MEFKKFTTRYNAHQDRLCIDGQSASGDVISLWLTYRVMRQLIPLLINVTTPSAEAGEKAAILAEWALSSAKTQQPQGPRVVRPTVPNSPGGNEPEPASWLISAIELKSTPQRAVLKFRIVTDKEVAMIDLKPEHLRQWLGIVCRLWNDAGWPANDWPAWFKAADSTVAPEGAVLH